MQRGRRWRVADCAYFRAKSLNGWRHRGCLGVAMAGARHFTELIVWQLADELRRATLALTDRPAFRRDLKLHSQTEDAVNSACRNMAEGFGCETHREFARFLRIARRSLNELQDAYEAAC